MPASWVPSKLPPSRVSSWCVLAKDEALASMATAPERLDSPAGRYPPAKSQLNVRRVEFVEQSRIREDIINGLQEVAYASYRRTAPPCGTGSPESAKCSTERLGARANGFFR